MAMLYQLGLFGAISDANRAHIRTRLGEIAASLGMPGGVIQVVEVESQFDPLLQNPSAVLYFGSATPAFSALLKSWLEMGIPFIPVVGSTGTVTQQLPPDLRHINTIVAGPAAADLEGSITTLLASVGLMPKQRRVFISYRRDDSRQAALQLFEVLSAHKFDVFLDTHCVPYAEDFQDELWHRLCDCDTLVMLDTEHYFEGRWTRDEFGRALATTIPVLRIGWPGVNLSRRAHLVTQIELASGDLLADGRLTEAIAENICSRLEQLRSASVAARHEQILEKVEASLKRIGGIIKSVGPHRTLTLELDGGVLVLGLPVVGIPTAHTLHELDLRAANKPAAILYEHIGIRPSHRSHLDWLAKRIPDVKWISSDRFAWDLSTWSV